MTFEKFVESLDESVWLNRETLCFATWNHQQAKIDRLMFEFCPDEMTPEQIKEFERNQK